MSRGMAVEFIGGPLDGERRIIEPAVEYRVPLLTRLPIGADVDLSRPVRHRVGVYRRANDPHHMIWQGEP